MPIADENRKTNDAMSFSYDEQTFSDLDIMSSNKHDRSIFNLFNMAKTVGGRLRIKSMMESPTTDLQLLKRRVDTIEFLQGDDYRFPITNQQIDFIEHYLRSDFQVLNNNIVDRCVQNFTNLVSTQESYYIISTGIKHILFSLKNINTFIDQIVSKRPPPIYLENLINQVAEFINREELRSILKKVNLSERVNSIELSTKEVFSYDNLYRKSQADNLKNIIRIIYEFDALIAVAYAGKKNNFALPIYTPSNRPELNLKDVYHPFVERPIKNNFSIGKESICLLTGSNMAGKSTLLKSVSLSVYLSHIGFPVPASKMETSVFDGLMTTINFSDNINLGYSHFLNEVKRVKEAALKLKKGEKHFIVFDELFRGTNVKDALEASILIIKACSRIKYSYLIVSTHLIEIANEVKDSHIDYKCFGARIEDSKPVFSYKLENGISNERLGMVIIKNEGILELLKSIIEPKE